MDLFTGRARLFKAGGCPTFVVRCGKTETVEGSSLPVGILSRVVGQQDALTLSEDQLVVLVSDGALADGGTWVAQQLELCAAVGNTPRRSRTFWPIRPYPRRFLRPAGRYHRGGDAPERAV